MCYLSFSCNHPLWPERSLFGRSTLTLQTFICSLVLEYTVAFHIWNNGVWSTSVEILAYFCNVIMTYTDFSLYVFCICEKTNTYKPPLLFFFSPRQRGYLLRERWVWQIKSSSSEDGEKVRDASDSQTPSTHRHSLVEQT